MKRLIAITIILILSVLALIWIFRNQIQPTANQTTDQMSGKITEIKDNAITVKGLIGLNTRQNKTVTFTTTGQTVFKNKAVIITEAEVKSGKPFTPQVQDKIGKFSDLKAGMNLILIKSQENLFTTDKATALEMDYASYVQQK